MFFGKKKKNKSRTIPPSGPPVVGLYGKHFSAGDFLKLNASSPEVQLLDAWLAKAMNTGQRLLPNWDKDYPSFFTAHFLLNYFPDDAAPRTLLGVMAPSHDKGGRDFPLVVFASLPSSRGIRLYRTAPHEPFLDEATRLMQRRNAMQRDELFSQVERLQPPDDESLELARQKHRDYLEQTGWIAAFTAMFGLSAPMQQGKALGTVATIVDGLKAGQPLPRYGVRCPLGAAGPAAAGLWLDLLGRHLPQNVVPNAIWSPQALLLYYREPSPKALTALLDMGWQDDTICDLSTATSGEERANLPEADLPLATLVDQQR